MARFSRSIPRSILITGASSGIGLATTKLFMEQGWYVTATMRNPENAPSWMRHERVRILPLDVTDRATIRTTIDQAIGAFGKIDVLLNNAGYGLNGPMEGATARQMRHQFDVNFFGLIDVTNAVLPHMRQRRSGLIINISSIGGLIGMPISPLYIASKHAVEGLTESIRFELKPFGVRVKMIEPGGIKTDFVPRSSKWTEHPDYTDTIKAMKAMSEGLQDSMSDPREVAQVIFKAANDRSDKLRYLAKPGPYVLMYRLLPDRLWRGLIQGTLDREAQKGIKARSSASSV